MAKKQYGVPINLEGLPSAMGTTLPDYSNLENTISTAGLQADRLSSSDISIADLNEAKVFSDQDYLKKKYLNQSTTDKIANSLIGGIGAGLLRAGENISYAPQVVTQLFDPKHGVEGNFISDLFKQGADKTLEAMPIYMDPDKKGITDQDFNVMFFKGMQSVLDSAVGFMVPGTLASKLVSGIGKISRLGRAASWLANATEGEAGAQTFMSKMFNNLATNQNIEKAIHAGFTGALTNDIEGTAMAVQSYKDNVAKLREAKANGLLDPSWTDGDIEQFAADRAWDFKNTNRLLMLQDIFMMHGIAKGLNSARAGIQKGLVTKFIDNFSNPITAARTVWGGATEGLEEMIQKGMEDEASYQTDKIISGKGDGKTYMQRLFENSTSSEALYEGAMGFFGGVIQGTLGHALDKAMNRDYYATRAARLEEQNRYIEDTKSTIKDNLKTMAASQRAIQNAIATGDISAVEEEKTAGFLNIAIDNFKRGTTEYLERHLKAQIESDEVSAEDKKEYQTLLDSLAHYENTYNKYSGYENQLDLFAKDITGEIIDKQLAKAELEKNQADLEYRKERNNILDKYGITLTEELKDSNPKHVKVKEELAALEEKSKRTAAKFEAVSQLKSEVSKSKDVLLSAASNENTRGIKNLNKELTPLHANIHEQETLDKALKLVNDAEQNKSINKETAEKIRKELTEINEAAKLTKEKQKRDAALKDAERIAKQEEEKQAAAQRAATEVQTTEEGGIDLIPSMEQTPISSEESASQELTPEEMQQRDLQTEEVEDPFVDDPITKEDLINAQKQQKEETALELEKDTEDITRKLDEITSLQRTITEEAESTNEILDTTRENLERLAELKKDLIDKIVKTQNQTVSKLESKIQDIQDKIAKLESELTEFYESLQELPTSNIEGQVGTSNYSVIDGLIFYNNFDGTVTPVANPEGKPVIEVITDDIKRREQKELEANYKSLIGLLSEEDARKGDDRFSKEINAKYKAELDSLKSTIQVEPTTDIETRKTEIQKRRQEELKDYKQINFKELKDPNFKYRLKDNRGVVLHKSEIRYSSYNNQLEFVNTKDIGEWLSKWYPTETYKNTNISNPDLFFRVDFSQFKEQLKEFYSGDGIKFLEEFEKLINAKYDIEAKKADIEKERQEALDNLLFYNKPESIGDFLWSDSKGSVDFFRSPLTKEQYQERLNYALQKAQKQLNDEIENPNKYFNNQSSLKNKVDVLNNIIQKFNEINAKYDAELATLEGAKPAEIKVEVISENYTPELLRANPNKLFLFGDNNTRTGKGGQAIIRDEPNAVGISTKLLPKNTPEAFMSDADFASNKAVINDDIYKAKQRVAKEGKTIVLPKGGFGTGLAALATKAPKTFEYLNRRLQEEFGFNNTTGELVALESTQITPTPVITLQGTIENSITLGNQTTISENEDSYILGGQEFKRVSNIIKDQISFTNAESIDRVKNSQTVGNYVDTLSRFFFGKNEYPKTFEGFQQFLEDNDRTPNKKEYGYFRFATIHSRELYNNLTQDLSNILEQLKLKHGNNLQIYTDDMLLELRSLNKIDDRFDGIAGTMDMFIIDENGNGHIYDFKTKSANTGKKIKPSDLESPFVDRKTNTTKDSDAKTWSKQQSIYAQILEQKTGKPITTSIIVIPVTYTLDKIVLDPKTSLQQQAKDFKPNPTDVKLPNQKSFIYELARTNNPFVEKLIEENTSDKVQQAQQATKDEAKQKKQKELVSLKALLAKTQRELNDVKVFYNNLLAQIESISTLQEISERYSQISKENKVKEDIIVQHTWKVSLFDPNTKQPMYDENHMLLIEDTFLNTSYSIQDALNIIADPNRSEIDCTIKVSVNVTDGRPNLEVYHGEIFLGRISTSTESGGKLLKLLQDNNQKSIKVSGKPVNYQTVQTTDGKSIAIENFEVGDVEFVAGLGTDVVKRQGDTIAGSAFVGHNLGLGSVGMIIKRGGKEYIFKLDHAKTDEIEGLKETIDLILDGMPDLKNSILLSSTLGKYFFVNDLVADDNKSFNLKLKNKALEYQKEVINGTRKEGTYFFNLKVRGSNTIKSVGVVNVTKDGVKIAYTSTNEGANQAFKDLVKSSQLGSIPVETKISLLGTNLVWANNEGTISAKDFFKKALKTNIAATRIYLNGDKNNPLDVFTRPQNLSFTIPGNQEQIETSEFNPTKFNKSAEDYKKLSEEDKNTIFDYLDKQIKSKVTELRKSNELQKVEC